MKVLRRTSERIVFGLGVREKTLLDQLLGYYPVQPESRPQLSRNLPAERLAEAETLLHEALREQKKELAAWLHTRFAEGESLSRTGSGWRLTLKTPEVECFLQVLNELRVGAWTRLGCPENLDDPALAESNTHAPFHAIMMVAGQFEMVVLLGLGRVEEPETGAETPPPPTPASD